MTMPISHSAMDLITKLLQTDSAKRLTAEEALNHPWMKGETATHTPMDPMVMAGLKSFDAQWKMKQAVLRLMVDTLSPDEVESLKKTFASMDEDHDGNITFAELQKAMKQAIGSGDSQLAKNSQEIEQILKKADLDGNGSLSYEELMLSYVHRKLTAKEERLWNAFCKLDLDGDGRVTVEEMEKVLTAHNVQGGKSDTKKMISEVDKNGDGTIDYEEFLAMMWAEHFNEEHGEQKKKQYRIERRSYFYGPSYS